MVSHPSMCRLLYCGCCNHNVNLNHEVSIDTISNRYCVSVAFSGDVITLGLPKNASHSARAFYVAVPVRAAAAPGAQDAVPPISISTRRTARFRAALAPAVLTRNRAGTHSGEASLTRGRTVIKIWQPHAGFSVVHGVDGGKQ